MLTRTQMSAELPEVALAQALVEVTRAVPGVAGLYAGHFGEIATYGRGRRVPGIRIRTDRGQVMVEAHLIVTYAPNMSIPTLAETVRNQIRQQLATLATAKGGAIDVVIDDIAVPATPPEMRAP
jgi:uncharacterized alkaline shock family protein YloU